MFRRLKKYLGRTGMGLLFIFVILPYFMPGIRAFFSDFFKPFLPGLSSTVYSVPGKELLDENITLQKKLNETRFAKDNLQNQAMQNHELKKMLKLKKSTGYEMAFAEILARNPLTWDRRFVINAGKNKKIMAGYAVIVKEGLVGRISEVSANTSVVLTVFENNLQLGCRIRGTAWNGILQGTPESSRIRPESLMKYIPVDARLNKGQVVVTSGFGNLIPPGIRIGTVATHKRNGLDQSSIVKIYADFKTVRFVSVVIPVTLNKTEK